MKGYKADKESFSESLRKEVYEVVSQISVRKVSTYGGIALLLGASQCSRMAGRASKEVPDELSIPYHRVVNSTGRLVPGWVEQKQLLLAKEVPFRANGCINLKEHLWHVDERRMQGR